VVLEQSASLAHPPGQVVVTPLHTAPQATTVVPEANGEHVPRCPASLHDPHGCVPVSHALSQQ
jgi:hypothetical protein